MYVGQGGNGAREIEETGVRNCEWWCCSGDTVV